MKIDLKGKKFGKLTVLEYSGKDKYSHHLWRCRCECGEVIVTRGNSLMGGSTQSCGLHGRGCHKHGMSKTDVYKKWTTILSNSLKFKTRDNSPSICEEWTDKENGFENFYKWAISNGYSSNLSLIRINKEKSFSPENCKFIDKRSAKRNSTIFIEFNDIKKSLSEWGELLNIPYYVLYQRIFYSKWSIEKALTTGYNKRGTRCGVC